MTTEDYTRLMAEMSIDRGQLEHKFIYDTIPIAKVQKYQQEQKIADPYPKRIKKRAMR